MSSMFKPAKFEQPKSFTFTSDNLKAAEKILAKYPPNQKRSAVMPLLDLAQRQHDNWIPIAAMNYIADILEISPMQVYEVANFYTMYNKQPVGKNLMQICRTTPCWLRGSSDITEACKDMLSIEVGETTLDGQFTLVEVECLGACINAPVIQINDDYYEDLDKESLKKIIEELKRSKKPSLG